MQQQNIGDKPAFPGLGAGGLTYREWLIGQALQGFCANPAFHNSQYPDPSFISSTTLQHVDNILVYLQKESDSKHDS